MKRRWMMPPPEDFPPDRVDRVIAWIGLILLSSVLGWGASILLR